MAMKDPKKLAKIINLTPEQLKQLESHYAKEAAKRKTEQVTMRMTERFKNDIKRAAEVNGFPHYQQWVHAVLYEAVAKTFPAQYDDPGDDF